LSGGISGLVNSQKIDGIIEARQLLIQMLTDAAVAAQQAGKIPLVTLPEVTIERPQNADHGDYASSFPLKLARSARANPMALANELLKFLPDKGIADVAAAPPGFINFTLKTEWLTNQVNSILTQREKVGNSDIGKGKSIQLEFVSANPTGPLHVGNGRGAILGSALASVFTAAGYRVEQEYYVNDAGNQVGNFYRSLLVRYQQALNQDAVMPAEGYQGTYMQDLAKEIVAEQGDRFLKMPETEALKALGQIGLQKMLVRIRHDLELLGVHFDVWFSEQSLYDTGLYNKVSEMLRCNGYLTERENATWFVSTALGDDKDNVVIRGDGTPTYFASDIAYHYDKLAIRKFDRVIDIWGADHQGHVSRMKAVVSALGMDPRRLDVILYQLVTLLRGNEVVRLSKRSGDMITLQEVIEEVGKDACRFFFLARSADSQMDFDLELAKKQSQDNPVYYVQYAHARICSLLKMAEEKGIEYQSGDVSVLITEAELTLIRKMLRLSEIIEIIAETSEPHHLTYYAQELATVFHSFYRQCRVMTEDQAITAARLKLVQATQIALAKTLHLMGISAPEKM
jgi:arginyl-tRNA synthetase